MGMLLENIDLNLIKLFFRYANFVKRRYKSCKCFKGFQVFLFDIYQRSDIVQLESVNVIIIYKEKGKTDDLRKLTTQNIIKIRFLLCKFVQACKLV